MTRPVVIVIGPTASGKSTLALALAERLPGVVINADSMQVYRDLAVLTARPDAAALARARHRLYGDLDGAEICSAAHWRARAMAEIVGSGDRIPIVTGGTGLYVNALIHGLANVPEVSAAVRRAARARCTALSAADFHAELAARDPVMAARIAPGDRQRLTRAWEVIEATGRSLAEWQAAPVMRDHDFRFLIVVLLPPRSDLHRGVESRFWRMVEGGALAEVRALVARRLDPTLPVMKAVGVAELRDHLSGETSLDEAVAHAQTATRRYIKRQTTWLRHQLRPRVGDEVLTVDAQFSDSLTGEIFPKIRQFVLTDSD